MRKILMCLFMCLSLCLMGCESSEMKKAKSNYESEVKRITKSEETLKKSIKSSEKVIKEKLTPLDINTQKNLEKSIADAKASIKEIPECPDNEQKIEKLIKNELSKIDYDKQNTELLQSKKSFTDSVKQYSQLKNPKEAFVLSRLKEVAGITGMAAVTEDHDPNGHLNKAGGYTSTIYFTYKLVNQSDVFGNNIIDKGTQAGGSIEVYANEKDAKKRNDYLATFDGTIMDSGSHNVYGTCIFRTSDKLSASKQKELERNILNALSRLD